MSVIEIKNSNEVQKAFNISESYFKECRKYFDIFEKDLTEEFTNSISQCLETKSSKEEMNKMSDRMISNINKEMQNLYNNCDPVRPNEFAFIGYLSGCIVTQFNLKTKEILERELMKEKLGGLGGLLGNLFKND